jgi:uncharacterized membrane protein
MMLRLFRPQTKSFWRGSVVGLVAHYLAVGVLVSLVVLLRPFVWAALYGTPYTPGTGPIDPSSGEGTVLQFIGMLSWVPAGVAAMRWGGNSGLKSALALLAYLVCVSLIALTQDMPSMSLGRTLWYWLCSPFGLAVGVVLHQLLGRHESQATGAQVST